MCAPFFKKRKHVFRHSCSYPPDTLKITSEGLPTHILPCPLSPRPLESQRTTTQVLNTWARAFFLSSSFSRGRRPRGSTPSALQTICRPCPSRPRHAGGYVRTTCGLRSRRRKTWKTVSRLLSNLVQVSSSTLWDAELFYLLCWVFKDKHGWEWIVLYKGDGLGGLSQWLQCVKSR